MTDAATGTDTRREVKTRRVLVFPKVSPPVFLVSALLILGFILFGAIWSETAKNVFTAAQDWITKTFGWYFVLQVNIILIFCVYLAFGRYGDIRLGEQTEEPQYGLLSWTAMLFSAGIGIGLMYWAVAEPLFHFMSPPIGEPETAEAAKQAMVISFMHWGLYGWGVYCVVALSLAYFHFRRKLPLSIRSGLYPLIGDKMYGWMGHTVDILAVFGTMFGIVTSLGLGVMQVNSGLKSVFGAPEAVWLQLALIGGITALATISVVAGLDKGIKRISQLNIWLSILLLGFMFIVGPTLFILESFVENTGDYLIGMVDLGFWNEAWKETNWQGSWTIFYWAWWVSWAPFVGVFIARISRGRTIREFVVGVLTIPCAILFFWFTAFGGTALHLELNGDPGLVEAVKENYGQAMFRLLELYPLSNLTAILVMVMIIIWFVTSSDSGSFVIDMLTAGGDRDPPRIQRVFWATAEGGVAAVLLVAGGLNALQAAAVIAGLPFSMVVFLMAYGLYRALGRDKLILYRAEQRYRSDAEVEANVQRPIAGE